MIELLSFDGTAHSWHSLIISVCFELEAYKQRKRIERQEVDSYRSIATSCYDSLSAKRNFRQKATMGKQHAIEFGGLVEVQGVEQELAAKASI